MTKTDKITDIDVFISPTALRALLSSHVALICDHHPGDRIATLARILIVSSEDSLLRITELGENSHTASVDWRRLGLKKSAELIFYISDENILKMLSENFINIGPHKLLKRSDGSGNQFEICEALALAHRNKYEFMANLALSAQLESYGIRRDLENSKSAQFELQEIARKSRSMVPWLNQVTQVGTQSAELNSNTSLEQILPYPSKGFAGFDLHFDWVFPDSDLELKVNLHIADSGELVGSWSRHLLNVGGWLHFRLEHALEERGAAMLIRLDVVGPTSSTTLPRISLSDVDRTSELSVNAGHKSIAGKALAFRVWQGPPGLLLPVEDNPTYALKSKASPGPLVVPLNWQLPNARPIGAVSYYNEEHPGSVGVVDGAFQLHVVPNGVSIARIERGLDDSFLDVVSEIHVAHPSGPFIEFMIGFAPSDCPDSELIRNLEQNLIVHSGWHVAGPNSTNLLTVERTSNLHGTSDIILATRTRSNGSTDYGWARFLNLRASWHPQRAHPLKFNISPDAEPLNKLRRDLLDRRNSKIRNLPTRTVSLACPLHRPQDIPNLLRQLAKLWSPEVEILVAANGERITDRDIDWLKRALPSATVWRDPGRTLGSILNSCIDRSSCEIFAKIDADDLYGENYLSDMTSELDMSGADIVGKSEFGVLFADENRLAIHRGLPHSQFVPQVAGGTLMCALKTARSVRFDENLQSGEDLAFQNEVQSRGGVIWSCDIFNYVHVRMSDSTHHTWVGNYNDYRCWPVYRDYGADNLWMLFA